MILTSQHSISLKRLGEQNFAGKIKSIHNVFGQTFLIYLKPHLEQQYHQLVHLDQDQNILWTKNFKQNHVLLVDVINQQKILIVTRHESESGYIIQIYDIKDQYKLITRKIIRKYLFKKQNYFIHKYFLSKCKKQICFLEQSKEISPSVFFHVYNLSSLELICHPLQYHCQITQFFTFQQPFVGCLGLSAIKKIEKDQYQLNIQNFVRKQKNYEEKSQNVQKNEAIIQNDPLNQPIQQIQAPIRVLPIDNLFGQNPNNNNLFANNLAQNNLFANNQQNNIFGGQPNNNIFGARPNINNPNRLNQPLLNSPVRILPENQINIISEKNQPSYYQIQLILTWCKDEVIHFKSHKYKCQFNNTKPNSTINCVNIMIKNERQIILCFEQRYNSPIFHLHFFKLNLEDNHSFLHYLGFFMMNQKPWLPISIAIQNYYYIDERILLIYKCQYKFSSGNNYCMLWLQENQKSDEMILKKDLKLYYNCFPTFFFKKDDGAIQMTYEQKGDLKVKGLKCVLSNVIEII